MLVVQRVIDAGAGPGADQRAGKATSASQTTLNSTRPDAVCNTSAVASTVKLKSWKMPRRSCLFQPRILAQRIGSGPDRSGEAAENAAGKADRAVGNAATERHGEGGLL